MQKKASTSFANLPANQVSLITGIDNLTSRQHSADFGQNHSGDGDEFLSSTFYQVLELDAVIRLFLCRFRSSMRGFYLS